MIAPGPSCGRCSPGRARGSSTTISRVLIAQHDLEADVVDEFADTRHDLVGRDRFTRRRLHLAVARPGAGCLEHGVADQRGRLRRVEGEARRPVPSGEFGGGEEEETLLLPRRQAHRGHRSEGRHAAETDRPASVAQTDGRPAGSARSQAAPDQSRINGQAGSGSTTRSAVSPWSFAQAAKNAARRVEMIRASLHGQSGTRHAGRTGGSVAPWRSHLMSITRAPFVWVGAKASASLGSHASRGGITDASGPGGSAARTTDIPRARSLKICTNSVYDSRSEPVLGTLWGCVVSTGPGYRRTRAEDATGPR